MDRSIHGLIRCIVDNQTRNLFVLQIGVEMHTAVLSPTPRFRRNATEHSSTTQSETQPHGTYYINGPGRFHFGNQSYNNWLDGDGMVTSIQFQDQQVNTTTRYVQGKKFIQERKADERIYRTFGTGFKGDKLFRGFGTASPYNVSVFRYQNKLLAFGEQSLPMELDAETLETKTPGRTFDFDRQINEAMPFSAHPKIEDDGELLNFGIFFDRENPQLIYYRFDNSGELVVRVKHSIPYPCSVHDFASSENYVVFYLSPHLLDTERLIAQGKTLSSSLDWCPEQGSRIVVLCRHTGRKLVCQTIQTGYNLHTIDCHEHGGRLFLDLIEYQKPLYDEYQNLPNLFSDVSTGTPKRFALQTGPWCIDEIIGLSIQGTFDFPVSSPLQPNGFWVLGISNWNESGTKFFDQLVRINWDNTHEAWHTPQGLFMGGEPATALAKGGKEVLICPIYDATAHESHIGVFDATSISLGPIELIKLGHTIPLGFHSAFYSG